MRKILVAGCLTVAATVLEPSAATAQEPRPLPETACNQGTAQARTIAPEPADPSIPHERHGECHHATLGG